MTHDVLVTNIGVLATPKGTGALKGAEMADVELIQSAAVAIDGGLVSYAGPMDAALKAETVIDAEGCLVTPGLVDCHTHLVFGGWREHELSQKLAGVPYLEILKRGGGILSTVRATRAATHEALEAKTAKVLADMLRCGTTTVEAKSGYGLSSVDEMKQLQVAWALDAKGPMDIVPTFLGAHAVPNEYRDNRDGYIRLLTEEMIPFAANNTKTKFCDIFCETGVFSADESRVILKKAKEYGFKVKLHADEIDPIGGAEAAAELKAISAEHLIQSTDAGINAMSEAGVIGVLLPGTSFYLGKPYARARFMIEHGMAVAVATDFNPGSCPNSNMHTSMILACLKYKMTPEETLTAATLNAAAAIDRAKTAGSLEPGKLADIVIWDAPNLDYIFYRFGSNLVKKVLKKGVLAAEA